LRRKRIKKINHRPGTIAEFVTNLIKKKPDIATLVLVEKVDAKFPGSAFNHAHAAYYRCRMRDQGFKIPLLKQQKKNKRLRRRR